MPPVEHGPQQGHYGRITMKHTLLATLFAGVMALPALAADYTIMAPAGARRRLGPDRPHHAGSVDQSEGISGSMCRSPTCPAPAAPSGLAQFANQDAGNPNALIVGGYVMVGAILTNASPVTLADVTPIARLTGEAEAIVVPAASADPDASAMTSWRSRPITGAGPGPVVRPVAPTTSRPA
jgi:putative tricarboxylic transport membrane protein